MVVDIVAECRDQQLSAVDWAAPRNLEEPVGAGTNGSMEAMRVLWQVDMQSLPFVVHSALASA